MDPKSSTDAMSQGLRSAAETTLAKAKEAVDQYMKQATHVFSTVESTAQATQSGARDITHKAIGYAEANIAAAFDFAQQLVRAKDAQEFLKMQQSFMQKQAENLGAQIREMGSAAASAASGAAAKAQAKE
ncbi:MAG: phasin family protein [Hyphomicrobiales bacterium]